MMLQKVFIVLFQLRVFLEVLLLPVEGILYSSRRAVGTRMSLESVPPSYSSEGRWELETCRWELEGTPSPGRGYDGRLPASSDARCRFCRDGEGDNTGKASFDIFVFG